MEDPRQKLDQLYLEIAERQQMIDALTDGHPLTEHALADAEFNFTSGQANLALVRRVIDTLPGGEIHYESSKLQRLADGSLGRTVTNIAGTISCETVSEARKVQSATVWRQIEMYRTPLMPTLESNVPEHLRGSLPADIPVMTENRYGENRVARVPCYQIGEAPAGKKHVDLLLAPARLTDPAEIVVLPEIVAMSRVSCRDWDKATAEQARQFEGPPQDAVLEGFVPSARSFELNVYLPGSICVTHAWGYDMYRGTKTRIITHDHTTYQALTMADYERFGVGPRLQRLAATFGKLDEFADAREERDAALSADPRGSLIGVTDYHQVIEAGDAAAALNEYPSHDV